MRELTGGTGPGDSVLLLSNWKWGFSEGIMSQSIRRGTIFGYPITCIDFIVYIYIASIVCIGLNLSTLGSPENSRISPL
jgi:hypothetical protein